MSRLRSLRHRRLCPLTAASHPSQALGSAGCFGGPHSASSGRHGLALRMPPRGRASLLATLPIALPDPGHAVPGFALGGEIQRWVVLAFAHLGVRASRRSDCLNPKAGLVLTALMSAAASWNSWIIGPEVVSGAMIQSPCACIGFPETRNPPFRPTRQEAATLPPRKPAMEIRSAIRTPCLQF